MFTPHFNRVYEFHDFPHFVPKEELAYNLDYAQRMVEEKWIFHRWREDVERGGIARDGRYRAEVEKITAHGGLILEICAGPDGGHIPAILMKDYNARIMVNDLCPTVVREWQKLFAAMDNPPPNIEYAAFNVCDMPFHDNCLDVVSGRAAVINIEGGGDSRNRALREVYRVLKQGGLFVFDLGYVTEEFFQTLPAEAQKILKERYPTIFWDTLKVFDTLGFSQVEEIETGTWSNENDESDLADLCRSLGVTLAFSGFNRFCTK
ncbi:MAG: class I SAM-dependent methyltransferase [Defluviitaleaceae bacterium]|nr:class I SAM-dependent methyltransferase [Defluviitaleaceae bacterium]MCL2274018.1 class I SAM-dependent methyltransferase [Defluviitaleaceae bacterium]MCL2274081.1 class I SAM-dependent methyltransferase [Defluviitaleaceae bacterium]